MTMNLLFVDNRVTQYQQIVDSVNANTQCVVFDFHSDSFASLLAKCNKPSYNSIGLLQHNDHLPQFQMLSSMSPALLGNNNDFSSWNHFKDFITSLKNEKNIQNFDMMACALYSDPSWKAVLDYVENVTGVNIRASLDDTGSAVLGGNWFLESDGVNLKTVYFTDAIDNYDGLLGSNSYNSGFITTNNELYVWGPNANGQLSTLNNPTTVPTLFPNMSNVKQVSFGYNFTIILKTDGTVVGFGTNGGGQINVESWSNIIATSAGAYNTVGLKSDGTVVGVGTNYYGQINVESWSNIVAISVGLFHTAGVKSDGTVVATGSNSNGQINIGDWTNIIAISCGSYYTIGLKRDGTVVAVGTNAQGQSNVGSWTNIIAISNGYNHTVGLKSDGTVLAVGDNYYGNCNVGGFNNIISISAGFYHTIGLKNNGTMVSVGRNNFGQLGDGTTTNRSTVINVNTSVTNIKRLYDIPALPSPTIGSFSIASKTFGDAAFAITAPSSNSNGVFSYSSSNTSVATISGSNITIVGAGSTMITATQAATSNYDTGSVTATLLVVKANPTIQPWSLASKTFGDAAFAMTAPSSNSNGSFSYSSSNTNVATVSGSNITIVGAGSTMITSTQAATTNYETGSVTANLLVAKAIPTINVTLKDGNNNTITPSNNIYTVVFNKNKIPRMDKLTLTSSSNNNASALSSVVQSGSSFVQYSSNGNIRLVNNGTVTIKVSQDETSNYLATEKSITLYITALAIQGRRPVFLRGL
jgi:hypothetical protein